MPIIYREQKGMPLTVAEMDGNFRDLDERLKKIEERDPRTSSPLAVELEGDILIFKDYLGQVIGKCRLPLPVAEK